MKKINITYWITTGLFAFVMFGSALPDVVSAKDAVEGFGKIGLPASLVPFVGVAKVLGVVAILIPGYPRLKEWAYAGLTFDLIGATYCMASAFHSITAVWFMLVPFALAFLSYIFYHKKLGILAAGKGHNIAPADIRTTSGSAQVVA